jgi:hypothetical protein
MSCCSSRAMVAPTGSCARTRTGSVRRRRSACSRCAAPGWRGQNPSLCSRATISAPGSVVVASADWCVRFARRDQALVAPVCTRWGAAAGGRRQPRALAPVSRSVRAATCSSGRVSSTLQAARLGGDDRSRVRSLVGAAARRAGP